MTTTGARLFFGATIVTPTTRGVVVKAVVHVASTLEPFLALSTLSVPCFLIEWLQRAGCLFVRLPPTAIEHRPVDQLLRALALLPDGGGL